LYNVFAVIIQTVHRYGHSAFKIHESYGILERFGIYRVEWNQ